MKTIYLLIAVCVSGFSTGYITNEFIDKTFPLVFHDTTNIALPADTVILHDTAWIPYLNNVNSVPYEGTWKLAWNDDDTYDNNIGFHGLIIVRDGDLKCISHCQCEEDFYVEQHALEVLCDEDYEKLIAVLDAGYWISFADGDLREIRHE